MDLYRLTRIAPDYEDVSGFVVVAVDEIDARALPAAERNCGGECRDHRERNGDVRPCVWQSETTATCEWIGVAADGWTSSVVLRGQPAV